ncbi:universal stress protein, partial [Acinetobacter baumannii]
MESRQPVFGRSADSIWRRTMYDRILVAVDGSPTADRALDEAIQLALKLDAELIIAHVIDNNY